MWFDTKQLQLVTSIKSLRSKALNVVKHIATELELFGQATGSLDAKKAIIDACSLLKPHDVCFGSSVKAGI